MPKEDNMKNKQIVWVKKAFDKKEWNNFYHFLPAYCYFREESDGVVAGFCAVRSEEGQIPYGCSLLSDDELKWIDDYRKMANIDPRPFEDVL
jgi:hypothetical protein